MVNMPYADEAVEIAHDNGFADKVGLHLNLTEGRSLTDEIQELDSFCDANGNFNAIFHSNTFSRLYLNAKAANALKKEIEAQLRKYKQYRLSLFHMDPHHHSHTDFSVFKTLKPLLKKYNIRSMRISRNMFARNSWYNKIYKKLFNNSVLSHFPHSTGYFGSINDFMTVKNKIGINKNKVIELMVHPVYKDNIIMDSNKKLAAKIKKLGRNYELISYKDISRGYAT